MSTSSVHTTAFLHCHLNHDEIICDQFGGNNDSEDILTTIPNSRVLRWYSDGGLKLIREYSLPVVPRQPAIYLFCSFTMGPLTSPEGQVLQKAIAVLLDDSHLQIYLHSGESFYLNLPVPMAEMLALPIGLLFKRNAKHLSDMVSPEVDKPFDPLDFDTSFKNLIRLKSNETHSFGLNDSQSLYFSLSNPSATVLPVFKFNSDKVHFGFGEEEERLLAIHQKRNIVCIYKPKKKSFVLYEVKTLSLLTTASDIDNKTDSSVIDTSQFIHHNVSLELENIPEFDNIPQRSSLSPHVMYDPIISMTQNLASNSSGSINNLNKGFIPISNTSRRFRQSPTIGSGTPPVGTSSPSLLMFGSGNSNSSNNNGNSNSRNSEALQSFLGFHPPKGPREKEKSLRSYQLNSNNQNNNLFMNSLSSNNNNNISNNSAFNSTSSSNLFDKRFDHSKQIISSVLPNSFSEFRLISTMKEISLANYYKNDQIDSIDDVNVTFSGDFNLLGGLMIHIHLLKSKRYFSYSLTSNSKRSNSLKLFHQLKYSNHDIALAELNNQNNNNNNNIVSIFHVNFSLDYNRHNKIYQLGNINYSVVDDLDTSSVPLTLLVESNAENEQKISIVLGGIVIKESTIVEIADDLSINGTTLLNLKLNSFEFRYLYAHSSYFCINKKNQISIYSFVPLLETYISNSFDGTVNNDIMDIVKSVIYNFIKMDIQPIAIEIIGVLLSLTGLEVDWKAFLVYVISATYGVSAHNLSFCESQMFNYFSKLNNSLFSIERLRRVSVDYWNKKSNSYQFGDHLLNFCHNILQDYLLRFNNDQNNISIKFLKDSLSCTYRIVIEGLNSDALADQYLITNNIRISLKNQIIASFDFFYNNNRSQNNNVNNIEDNLKAIDAIAIYQSLLKSLSDPLAIQYIVDKIVTKASYYLCITLKLVVLFFSFLSKHINENYSWSRKIIDAVVHTLYANANIDNNNNGVDKTEYDWLSAIQFFPYMIRIIIELAVNQCRFDPNKEWPDHVLKVIGRNDLCRNDVNFPDMNIFSSTAKGNIGSNETSINEPEVASDGLFEVETSSYLRFTEDDRLHEVCRLLCSSKTIYLKVEKSPEISELDHRHKLQMKLLVLCRRTLACSIGRGMLTMSSLEPLMAEALPIPPISLSGRVPPNNSIINLDTSTAPTDLTLWPEYNNGVAASLRIGPSVKSVKFKKGNNRVTRNWIIYNKTACVVKPGGESSHAGFLLGLGLQGHLTVLSVTDICDYLTQGNDPTTVSVLIGCAASKIGSADPLLSKTLCLHLPALLPSQHWDIEISPLVQSAALVGLGLLHCGSGHRLMTEFLLSELVRMPSSSSSESCENREAIALSASWALGMVLLGKGSKRNTEGDSASSLQGLVDLRIEDRLEQFMNGGKKPSESSLFPSFSSATFIDASSKSSKILEGDVINTDVTSPGATIALAMIYIRSNNADILNRLSLPNTVIVLDSIRPDMLIYRALGRCLVMWDGVIPSDEWIDSQIPTTILNSLFIKLDDRSTIFPNKALKLNQRSAFPLYVSAIAGFCYGIGMIYAGSSDEVAMNTILRKLKMLQSFRDNKPLIKLGFTLDKSMRHVVEMCICVVALSLSCVMAGSGNLDCLRIFRELRWKVDDVSYGSHLSMSMSIGMLFLAGGNYSLKRDPISTACLLLSICPRYPSRTIDNQYHLQALRHMYVLATENRALHTIDVDTGSPVNLNVDVLLKDGSRKIIKAPGLLPELSTICEIKVNSTRVPETSCKDSDVTSNNDYYSTSLLINTELESVSQNGIKGISQKFSQIIIPPLLVKRITPSITVTDGIRSLSEKEYQNNIINKLLSQRCVVDSSEKNGHLLVSMVKQHRIDELLSILVDSKGLDVSNNITEKNNTDVIGSSLVLDSYPLTKVIVEALIES